ncbi:HU family DNA-binding protein [candidate division KSB1 bacterium]|nr:HU family DNA-binding protein [candidate division KSB1 bacterium]
MTTTEVVSILAARLNISQTQAREILQRLLAASRESLVQGNGVSIRGFGTFDIKKRAPRRSFNPFTKKWLRLPPRINAIFKPGSKLKRRINERSE